MINKIKHVLSSYLSSAAYAGIHHKIVCFMVDLKYTLPTRINQGLANELLEDLKLADKKWDSKVHHVLLRFMREEVKDRKGCWGKSKFEKLL